MPSSHLNCHCGGSKVKLISSYDVRGQTPCDHQPCAAAPPPFCFLFPALPRRDGIITAECWYNDPTCSRLHSGLIRHLCSPCLTPLPCPVPLPHDVSFALRLISCRVPVFEPHVGVSLLLCVCVGSKTGQRCSVLLKHHFIWSCRDFRLWVLCSALRQFL